jgi:hypothetical protein
MIPTAIGVAVLKYRLYDIDQLITIDAFSARLREQIDLDTLSAELLGGRGPDDAADPGVAVAAALRQCVPGPEQKGRVPCGLVADANFPDRSHALCNLGLLFI